MSKEYITELDDVSTEGIADLMPANSFIAKTDGKIIRGNITRLDVNNDTDYDHFDSRTWVDNSSYTLAANLIKDNKGHVVVISEDYNYLDEMEAYTLYYIAEPDGKPWHEVKESKKKRYIRLAVAARISE